MPDLDLNMVLAAVFGLFVFYYLVRILAAPAKILFRFLLTGVVGAAILFVFNVIAGFFSVAIGINIVTALVVGFMGLPGLAMLIVIQKMLG